MTDSIIACPVDGMIFTPPRKANLIKKIISIEIIHVRIMESVMTNLPIENTPVDEELTPPPWPAQYAILGNSVGLVRISTNLAKQLFHILITDDQCCPYEKHFS
jgi:hypothetical protein